MTGVDWKHNILASTGYAGHSHRIARIRAAGGTFPPPYRSGHWPSPSGPWPLRGSWSANTDEAGQAPDSYGPRFSYGPPYSPMPAGDPYDSRTYQFAFWSWTGSSPMGTPLVGGTRDRVAFQGGGPWTVDARAWYVWDFGHGPGNEAIEIDAFCINDNDFIGDYFVEVFPDDPPTADHPDFGPLSYALNEDGYINTSRLQGTEVIKAKGIIGDGLFRYQFKDWWVVLSHTSPGLPNVQDSLLTVEKDMTFIAYARYERIATDIRRVADHPAINWPLILWGIINDAPGAYWIPGVGIVPFPGSDPWGPPLRRDLAIGLTISEVAAWVGDPGLQSALRKNGLEVLKKAVEAAERGI